MTGYAQDYIGQLARAAQIDARRIGGLWYISPDSLLAYQNKAEDFKPAQPAHDSPLFPDAEAFVHLDGREYISASRASKITGYNQDYIGQLARAGKIMSRQVGNRWYVDRDALLAHQDEKNTLLGAVQTESVGIPERFYHDVPNDDRLKNEPLLTYTDDIGDLLPAIIQKGAVNASQEASGYGHVIPIRVVTSSPMSFSHRISDMRTQRAEKNRLSASRKTLSVGIFPAFALTVVVVLSFGLISLKTSSLYTFGNDQTANQTSILGRLGYSSLAASAASGFDALISRLEDLLTTEEVYQRVR